jgi:predicted helicase
MIDVLTVQKSKVEVIITNPPYGKCTRHKRIDNRIKETYAKYTTAINKNSLYDGYIRAFRLFSDYLTNGIICMVVNNGFLDNKTAIGLRQELSETFDKIYVFDLKGNARTSGEVRRKQGGKVFGIGSRCGVCIIMLVRKESAIA